MTKKSKTVKTGVFVGKGDFSGFGGKPPKTIDLRQTSGLAYYVNRIFSYVGVGAVILVPLILPQLVDVPPETLGIVGSVICALTFFSGYCLREG